ncbi:hypothetical protein HPB48_008116 [Haemaphysalis longicornis]|uniref:Uncharacterized protein n=1 Tax=Haemaphysalis longicornis TaxID=44386 RepID=A0A9J6FTT3_HAELO|nr:hypothetical protein HPB48_008116 [Haemaphysalis longicornis]
MGSIDSLYSVDGAEMISRQCQLFLRAPVPRYTLASRVSEKALPTKAALAAVGRADWSHFRLDTRCFRTAAADAGGVGFTWATLERRVAEYATA